MLAGRDVDVESDCRTACARIALVTSFCTNVDPCLAQDRLVEEVHVVQVEGELLVRGELSAEAHVLRWNIERALRAIGVGALRAAEAEQPKPMPCGLAWPAHHLRGPVAGSEMIMWCEPSRMRQLVR